MREVYLDNNATTRPLPEVIEAMSAYMAEGLGNPSSAHGLGRRAQQAIEEAREAVRSLVRADEHALVFTSGGSESNSMVLRSISGSRKGRCRVITTAAEHSSILSNCEFLESQGIEIVLVPVDEAGRVDLDRLQGELAVGAQLVALHWVNSETGVIQDMPEVTRLCRKAGVPLLADAAQAVGKIPVNLQDVEVDYLSFSGHKFHGPQGTGALLVRRGCEVLPLIRGGDQETRLRAGTQNVAGIIGLGVAAKIRESRFSRVAASVTAMRDRFEAFALAMAPSVKVNGDTGQRVGNTTNLCFHGIDGQALLARLDARGVFVSQGSACTSRRPEPSHVLTAMGLSEDDAYASIRFSFSEMNDSAGVEYAAEELDRAYSFLRDLQAEGIAS